MAPCGHNTPSISSPKLVDFHVKVFNLLRKREFETFVFRKVSKEKFKSPEDVMKELIRQFGGEKISNQHSVGFMKGTSKVTHYTCNR